MPEKHLHIDLREFCRMWSDGVPSVDIAERFGVSRAYVHYVRTRYGLPSRDLPGVNTEPDAPTEDDEEASGESLALSPWVQARINELRIGMHA